MLKLEISYQVKMPLAWGGFLNKLAQATACQLKIKADWPVSLVFIGPQMIRKLNRLYRHQDAVTDVLSFTEIDEIFICYARAVRQSKTNNIPVKQEIGWLFIHGLLHLRGYTHETEKKFKRMVDLQGEILRPDAKLR